MWLRMDCFVSGRRRASSSRTGAKEVSGELDLSNELELEFQFAFELKLELEAEFELELEL